MAITPNLQLQTTPTSDYTTVKVGEWVQLMNGITGSNMTKIDDFAGETDAVITLLKGVGWINETIKGNADAITQVNGRVSYTVPVTGTNTLVGTIPQVTTVLNNAFVKIITTASNTGAVTLNINTEGALPITKIRTISGTSVFVPLDANDLRLNNQYLLTKSSDGIRWISLTHSELFARNSYFDNGDTTYTDLQSKLESIDTAISGKVDKVGDTMTGNLNVPTINNKVPSYAEPATEVVITSGFATGWSGRISYWKTQENVLIIDWDLTRDTDITSLNNTVYTMPSGTRPKYLQLKYVNLTTSTLTPIFNSEAIVQVSSSGVLQIGIITGAVSTNARRSAGSMTYIAQ